MSSTSKVLWTLCSFEINITSELFVIVLLVMVMIIFVLLETSCGQLARAPTIISWLMLFRHYNNNTVILWRLFLQLHLLFLWLLFFSFVRVPWLDVLNLIVGRGHLNYHYTSTANTVIDSGFSSFICPFPMHVVIYTSFFLSIERIFKGMVIMVVNGRLTR